MNRCLTCKHFQPTLGTDAGFCGRWIASYNYRESSVPAGEVVVENDEGWGAMMHKDFGCVLWEIQ